MAKKGKTKSWKKQQEELVVEKKSRASDELTKGTRIGMVIMGYILFMIGSISALVIGYTGIEKRGAREVIIIGWILLVTHLSFLSWMIINPAKSGVIPLKIAIIVLLAIPIVVFLAGLTGWKKWWGRTLRITAMALVIPHYIVIGIINPNILWDKNKENETLAKAYFHQIRVGLDSYGGKHDGVYPPDIETLVSDQDLNGVPINPFLESPMLNVPFGDRNFEGNFSYLPVNVDGTIRAYYLVGYGSVTTSGRDINRDGNPDHVAIVYSSIGIPKGMTPDQYDAMVKKIPPIETLLK